MTKKLSASDRSIVLIESDEKFAGELKAELERNGYSVREGSATDLEVGELLVFELVPTEYNSLQTLKALRAKGLRNPILMITSLSSAEDVAKGLDSGADGYLTKPFSVKELVARVEVLFRRLGDSRPTKLSVDDLEIDLINQRAFRSGNELDLLPREFRLLEYCLRRPNQVVTPAMLLQDVWRYKFDVETNVVDAHIGRLRKKIDDRGLPSRIANMRRMGFMLRAKAT